MGAVWKKRENRLWEIDTVPAPLYVEVATFEVIVGERTFCLRVPMRQKYSPSILSPFQIRIHPNNAFH